jgi:hypothetical protein
LAKLHYILMIFKLILVIWLMHFSQNYFFQLLIKLELDNVYIKINLGIGIVMKKIWNTFLVVLFVKIMMRLNI